MPPYLPVGKLPAELLARLLAQVPVADPRVIVGPGVGQDAAVIDMDAYYLVAKTDPITFATDDIGWYAVNVNANDVACMGARPKWFLVSALLPSGRADHGLVENLFRQIGNACSTLGITLVGGHTEITYNLDRPILVGSMLGQVAKDMLVTSGGARPGDIVLLTKSIPVEGTALIAREKELDLLQRGFTKEFLARAKNALHDPGISVVREALLAAEAGAVTAMHDPTEGGLATGLRELAQASRVGLAIDGDTIPFSKEGIELCAAYGLDPLGVIASGSLLSTAPPAKAEQVLHRWASAGIRGTAIGRVVPVDQGLSLLRGGAAQPLPQFEVDEIAQLFG